MIQGTKSASISVERLGLQYSVVLFSEIEFPKQLGTHLSERMGFSSKGGEPRVTARPQHQPHQQRCSFKERGRAGDKQPGSGSTAVIARQVHHDKGNFIETR